MSKLPNKVIKNLDFLKKLSKTRSKNKRELLLKEASSEQLLLLVEICYNILKGYFPLNLKQKLRILPHIQFVRKLGRVKTTKSAKNVIQKGGGLLAFAPLLAPIIAEVIRNYG